VGAMGGMTDAQLAAGWLEAEDAGDFDAADEYEHEFFRRMWSHPDWRDASARMPEKRRERWNELVEGLQKSDQK
jgi:hypothetical protein